MSLPRFKYHPDPIATQSIVASDAVCRSCGVARGYIYTGPVYSLEDLPDSLCPWCIADGSAAARFDAVFVDAAGIGGYGQWDSVPSNVVEEISKRTPAFNGWQQERWWTHCKDGAEFLGPAGYEELTTIWSDAAEAIRAEAGYAGDEWAHYFKALDQQRGPTAYVFRCLHCSALGGYSDCH